MAVVTFEITFKATCPDALTYAAVKSRIDAVDLAAIGQNVTKTVNADDNPDGFVISVTVAGENTPPT